MMVPKILTPHLVFTPKFCIDFGGKYAVSRTPFLVIKEEVYVDDMIYFITAVLNSSVCFWYLLNHAPKYQQGYAMIEKKYLDELPIPEFNENLYKINQIVKLVKEYLAVKEDFMMLAIETKIDKLVTDLYGLSQDEIKGLNL